MVSYLKKRGYTISWVEVDEEAAGQYYMPEDYATLYISICRRDAESRSHPQE
jgi:hypothetical protein